MILGNRKLVIEVFTDLTSIWKSQKGTLNLLKIIKIIQYRYSCVSKYGDYFIFSKCYHPNTHYLNLALV